MARFLKPGGKIGIAGAGLMREFDDDVPDHLRDWWTRDMNCLHSAEWWRRHWTRSGLVDVEAADAMPDGWQRWLDWHLAIAPDNAKEIQALEADRGAYLGYVRAVARRRPEVELSDAVVSVPVEFKKAPLLREPA